MSARVRPGPGFDLLAAYRPDGAFFERGGIGVATAGVHERVAPADVADALTGSHEDEIPDVALGALPFADAAQGSLAIGRRAVIRFPGHTGVAIAEHGDVAADPFELVRGGVAAGAFTAAQLREVPPAADYERAVVAATDRIRRGELRKVVLARTIEVEADRALDPRRLAHRLRAVNPAAYTFAMPVDGGILVGATPELLVSRLGLVVRSNPLAGSAPRAGDPEEDRANAEALRASAKDREEHAIVVEDVIATLRPLCDQLTWDLEPVLLETPNVWHLSTRFVGRLKEPAPSALQLALALHPTPAIAGTPTGAALAAIAELEPFDRGAYAGPVGWVDATGDGEWAIALRCALLDGPRATLYAGAGIVADSDPASEADETERKFRAFLDALRWG
ncbi:MAG TPA: isochorismate synthase [Actinomycetota bacterium]